MWNTEPLTFFTSLRHMSSCYYVVISVLTYHVVTTNFGACVGKTAVGLMFKLFGSSSCPREIYINVHTILSSWNNR